MSSEQDASQTKVPVEAGDKVDDLVDSSTKSTINTPPFISCPQRHKDILKLLREHYSSARIRDELGLSYSTMKTYLSRMRRAKLINKRNQILIDMSLIEFPKEDFATQKTLMGYESSTGNKGGNDLKRTSVAVGNRDVAPIRTAILKLKFELLESPHPLVLAGWNQINLRNNKQFHTWFEGMYLMLTTKHLLVELPALDVNSAQDSVELAGKIAPQLLLSIEERFAGLKLKISSNGVQIVSPRHYAFQEHPFARWLLNKGIVWNAGAVHVDASKPDMRAEMEITDEEVTLSPEIHADAYKRQVIDQMQPSTPLISDLGADIGKMAADMKEMRSALHDAALLLKSTVDVQKLTAEQLQLTTKLMLPKQEQTLLLNQDKPFYIG